MTASSEVVAFEALEALAVTVFGITDALWIGLVLLYFGTAGWGAIVEEWSVSHWLPFFAVATSIVGTLYLSEIIQNATILTVGELIGVVTLLGIWLILWHAIQIDVYGTIVRAIRNPAEARLLCLEWMIRRFLR
ncbi:hypothetical protein [Natronorarus salvus]|uniref:hypothetical protein n=1 Tax=Natronorarus salvus TaxID=3117733 RepID=UPI002F262070